MAWLQVLVAAVVVWFITQVIVACVLRLYGNRVLFNPHILSRKNLSGYYAIVTGSNTGIGYEVVRYLVNHGAHCIMPCRDAKRGTFAEQSINAQAKRNAVYQGGVAEFMPCDLSSLASTKQFVADFKAKNCPLHMLINNAGLGGKPKPKFTVDGFELVFQINYLAHFLITHELLPVLIRSSTDDRFDCRIVNTSSIYHRHGVIDFAALLGDKQTRIKLYAAGRKGYGRSKLAQIMHATYLQQAVLTPNNIRIAMMSLHPGGVRTNIFKTKQWPAYMKAALLLLYPAWHYGMRSCEQGARTTIYCAVAPTDKTQQRKWGGFAVAGAYHENMKVASTADALRQSTDDAALQRLFQVSMELLKLTAYTKRDYQQWMTPSKATRGASACCAGITDDDEDVVATPQQDTLQNGVIVLTEKAYWFYSVAKAEWRKLCALRPEQRVYDGPCIVHNDDTLYRIGGRDMASDRGVKYGEYIKLKGGGGGGDPKWHALSGALNMERCSASAVFMRDHLLMIGGDCNGDEMASVEEYTRDAWTMKASMNKTRNDFGVCCVGDSEKLLVFGGHSVDGQSGISGYLDSVEQYDYARDEWTLLKTAMPFGKRARCGAFYWDVCNSVVVAGGTQPARNVVECLDLEKLTWTRFPDLSQMKWWSKIGTLSTESPKVLHVVGVNEESKLSVVEQLDTREKSQKWQTSLWNNSIAAPFNGKAHATCWV